jgi:hypothetical protein
MGLVAHLLAEWLSSTKTYSDIGAERFNARGFTHDLSLALCRSLYASLLVVRPLTYVCQPLITTTNGFDVTPELGSSTRSR